MKKYEEYVYTNFLDQRKKMKLEERLGELVRNADNKKIFPRGDFTTWSYKLFTITQIIFDTKPVSRVIVSTERSIEAFFKKQKLNNGWK